MAKPTVHVILAENDPLAAGKIESALADSELHAFVVRRVGRLSALMDVLEEDAPMADLILFDLGLPDVAGLEMVARVGEAFQSPPTVLLVEPGERALVKPAMRAGLQDVIFKDQLTREVLEHAIICALGRSQFEEGRRARSDEEWEVRTLESVARVVGKLAHDFNNLLSVVTSYAGVLLSDLPSGSKAEQDVHAIREATERAAAISRKLLMFGRREFLQPVRLPLGALGDALRARCRSELPHGVDASVELDPSLMIQADAAQLEAVLWELIQNAREAMPLGGRVTVRSETAWLDGRVAALDGIHAGPYVCLCVRDDGIGMDEETRRRAFEPFFSTRKQGRGVGLGLSTVWGVVRQSGGHVEIESAPRAGTTVRVYLARIGGRPSELRRRTLLSETPSSTGR